MMPGVATGRKAFAQPAVRGQRRGMKAGGDLLLEEPHFDEAHVRPNIGRSKVP
jgi:hypothetical protein